MLKELTFVVSAENHPELLARTVLLFSRLAISIHVLTMRRSKGSPKMRMTLEVLVHTKQSDRIVANLAKLANFVSNETRKQDAAPIRKPGLALLEKS
jgi:acetolactate synthase small subunit